MVHPGTAVRLQPWNSSSELGHQAIREQLDRLLASPVFSHSKRYPAFLRYVVEETLSGRADGIKERAIGVEVFEREADYDTNADPIVRVAAGEIRKRLAQYYYETGHEEELRFELPIGTYAPTFYVPPAPSSAPPPGAQDSGIPERRESEISIVPSPSSNSKDLELIKKPELETGGGKFSPSRTPGGRTRWLRRGALLALPVLGLAVAWFLLFHQPPKPSQGFDQFWGQVTGANGSVQLCFGTFSPHDPAGPGTPVMISSIGAMMRIRALLDERRKTYLNAALILGPTPPDLSTLRDGPMIFVGPYMPVRELLEPLRYSFREQEHAIWVHDRQLPSATLWRTDLPSVPVQQTSESYAIVARLLDRNLKRPMVIVAGVSPTGTVAASEVITSPKYMEALLRKAPPNWEDMNLESVVKTEVVGGKPGPPEIVATHFWK